MQVMQLVPIYREYFIRGLSPQYQFVMIHRNIQIIPQLLPVK